MHNKRSFTVALLIPLVFFTSCQVLTVSFLYRTLRWYMETRIDRYFDLTSSQEKKVKTSLDSHMTWYRKQGVNDIITIFRMAKRDIGKGFSEKDLLAYEPVFRRHQEKVAQRVGEDIVDFLMGLSSKQVDHLEKELEKGEKKFAKKMNKPREERIREQSKFTLQVMEFFLGNLTDYQRKEFYRLSSSATDLSRESLEIIKQRNRGFLNLLRKYRGDREVLKKQLEKWLETFEKRIPAGYRQNMELAKNQTLKNIIYFEKKLVTQKQRKHALERIDLVISMLEEGKKS